MQPAVGLVITEQPDHLDAEVRARYDRFAAVLAEISGGAVAVGHYLDPLPTGERLLLTGSYAAWATHDQDALEAFGARLRSDPRPVLGVCAGMQLLARFAGGRHDHMPDVEGEHGFVTVDVVAEHPALRDLPRSWQVFQQHGDEVAELPDSLELVASNAASRVQAFIGRERPWWGTQFHPERYDATHPDGRALLETFLSS